MKRRDFITLLGGAMVPLPSAARAQQPTMPVIGFLNSRAPQREPSHLGEPSVAGLKEAGYIEGQNLTVEYRWAEGQYDRLPGLVADSWAGSGCSRDWPLGVWLAKAATSTIPIVFAGGFDPVRLDLSLA